MIRCEEKRQSHGDYAGESARSNLRFHRITVVRQEQRATLLARAFLLGVPYPVIESPKSKPIDTRAIIRIARSIAWKTVTEEELAAWCSKKAQAA